MRCFGRHVCVPGRRIGGGAGHARSTEEAGGAAEGEPRKAVFLASLWLTRTTGSLRFWPSNSHDECFPVATSTGDTVRGETGGLLLHQTVVGLGGESNIINAS